MKSVPCPICQSGSEFAFAAPCDYRQPLESESFDVFWCGPCNFGQVWPRPTVEKIKSFYELDDYYTHAASAERGSADPPQKSFLERLRVHLAWRLDDGDDLSAHDVLELLNAQQKRFLEIGCGNGSNMESFAKQGFEVTGIEPDPKAAEAAVGAGLSVFAGTAEDLPHPVRDAKYDVVLMLHVLEHCRDINTAVANVASVLKHGGVFVVETPNHAAAGFQQQKAAWPWSDIPRHLNFFTPSSLRRAVEMQGFRVIKVKYRGFTRQLSGSWLENEKKINAVFSSASQNWPNDSNHELRAWRLLLRSVFASKAKKYDSVRMVALKI